MYTNDKLCKIGYIENYYCSFCNHEKESLYHLLFHCPHSNKFWKAFELYIFQVISQQVSLNLRDVILGVVSSICPTLNYLIIIGKLYLWDCRRNGVLLNVACFRAKVNIKIQTEKYISAINKTIRKFCNKWNYHHHHHHHHNHHHYYYYYYHYHYHYHLIVMYCKSEFLK